jgi:hypothetical protein
MIVIFSSIFSQINSLEIPTSIFGDHLKQQVSDRLKFYDNGALPPKNIDVMQVALQEAEVEREQILIKEKKRKKKEKKRRKAAAAALGENPSSTLE